jgi:hypothetical protein
MKVINNLILIYSIVFINNQVPSNFAVNSCGKISNIRPETANECIEEGEICCFVHLERDSKEKKFCAHAPSKIEKDEIKNEIKSYTNYDLIELTCNNADKINNIFISLLLLFLF